MIKNTDHCALCDLHNKTLEFGFICKLSNKPPSFQDNCVNIKLNRELTANFDRLNLKRNILNLSKPTILVNLFLLPILGIFTLLGDYLFYKTYIVPHGIFSTEISAYHNHYMLVILSSLFILGCRLIGKGIRPYLNYKEDKKMNENSIYKLETILKNYPTK